MMILGGGIVAFPIPPLKPFLKGWIGEDLFEPINARR